MEKVIFIPTVPHTGTWFVINFLSNFVVNFAEASQILKDNVQVTEPTLIHTHTPIYNPAPIQFAPNFPHDVPVPKDSKSLSIDCICLMASIFKTVIPVRDPLAAILTREARHPEFRHFFIVDGFLELATRLHGMPNVKFLPIDLPMDKFQRWGLLKSVVEHCEIDADPKTVENIAEAWKPQNITPGNRLKKLYADKEKAELERLLGPKMAEVEYLKNKAAILHPFLVDLGYTKGDIDLW